MQLFRFAMAFLVLVPLLSSCARASESARSIESLSSVRIGMPVDSISGASRLFAYDKHGHFGSKVQYNSRVVDELGGTYVLHCRDGVVYSVEVKFGADGIDRDKAMIALHRIISGTERRLVEHDDDDRLKRDCRRRLEFFYFGRQVHAELHYNEGDESRVSQISVTLSPC